MIDVAALGDAFHDDCLTKRSYVSGAERDPENIQRSHDVARGRILIVT
jgi:hypothetical protein